jgi:transposase
MSGTTVAIDLAKNVFELAVADESGTIIERRRLGRAQFQRFFENRSFDRVVMEACGTAHHWGRWFAAQGFEVSLLPPHYVRAYVRRNKTDRTDVTALLEASRATDIIPVRVKSVEQQALQSLHRVREAWFTTRTARINTLRGLCREFGVNAPLGAERGIAELGRQVADPDSAVPDLLRRALSQLLAEIRGIDEHRRAIDTELAQMARQSEVCERLQRIPGIGLITSTAIVGTVGDITSFRNSRRFASWMGLTPREYSSGSIRRLGSITKRGDKYLRTLLVHGARSVIFSANAAKRAGRPVDAFRQWASAIRIRCGHNKAVIAVANKLARIIWATWYRRQDFEFRAPGTAVAA